MILPIFAYGQSVLKARASIIEKDHKGLNELIANMWDTMYNASGVGLAAPQVGHSIRLFIVDTKQTHEEEEGGLKQAFINPEIIKYNDIEEPYEEGCLSIPNIHADVFRPTQVHVKYMDENFEVQESSFLGMEARVIQHEFDHLEGVLFTELLGPLKRKRLSKKLEKIRKGIVKCNYKLKFAQ